MERLKQEAATAKDEVLPVIKDIGEDLVSHPGSYVFVVGSGASAADHKAQANKICRGDAVGR